MNIRVSHHPKGLWTIILTEIWVAFSFYLTMGILPLFLRATDKGGMGMNNAMSIDIIGTYIAFIYLSPFIGGLIADRIFGSRKSIFLGGLLLIVGYFLLGLAKNNSTLYFSLICIIIGG